MIIVMNPNAKQEEVRGIKKKLEELGCTVHVSQGESHCVLGLVGDTSKINTSQIEAEDFVDKVMNVQAPYKRANRLFHPEDTIIKVEDRTIGKRISNNSWTLRCGKRSATNNHC